MEHVLLSMQHISKSYPGVQALDDVSLRLGKINAYEDPVWFCHAERRYDPA